MGHLLAYFLLHTHVMINTCSNGGQQSGGRPLASMKSLTCTAQCSWQSDHKHLLAVPMQTNTLQANQTIIGIVKGNTKAWLGVHIGTMAAHAATQDVLVHDVHSTCAPASHLPQWKRGSSTLVKRPFQEMKPRKWRHD